MSEVVGSIHRQEQIFYEERPSWLYYYCLYIVGAVLSVLLLESGNIQEGCMVVLMLFSTAAVFRLRYCFTVTSDRVISRVGLIARNTNEMKLRHIRTINTRQSPLERIFGIGTAIFISAADGEAAVVFRGIRDPQGVKDRVRDLI